MFSMGTISICQFYSEGWQEGGNRAFVVRCPINSHMILAECDEVDQIVILLRYLPGLWGKTEPLMELLWTSVCLALE